MSRQPHKPLPRPIHDKATQTFITKWLANPNYPLSKKNIADIVDEISPGRTVFSLMKSAPKLIADIEAACRKDHGKLPPVTVRGGHLVQRAVNGDLIYDKDSRGGNGAKPHANTPTEGGSRGGRIYWSDEEKAALETKMFEMWCGNPDLIGSVALVDSAMKAVIEEPRWRHITSPMNAGDSYGKFRARVLDVIQRGTGKIEPTVVERPVPVPYDVDKVLDEVSLEKLAGVLARREMEARLTYYALAANPHPEKAPKQDEKAALAEEGVDVANLDTILPLVQVIGFTPSQHPQLHDRFKLQPVRFAPSIAPTSPLEPSRLAQGCTLYIVDSTTTPRGWQEIVIAQIPFGRREKVHGPSRVIDHIKDHISTWRSQHQAAYAAWVRRQQAANG